ncbi:hypothetical protein TTHT_0928 [Thermotomaculum hydrothermale]|uniref:PilZ domain-containing protein n=1 Tax=Thermotomaculum hydrothermale TaxID=981385 RepID=A0A7R6PMU6_9BACT|nr:PilZ domain-containing protein [Thermotomaculum hydrothermale]BBB32483.1 hypothetical protein TTHT_0928 [Thermotomaculum hydrothermale]
MGYEEKRRHKRIDLKGYINIYPLAIKGNSNPLKGKFKNISEGGILFECSRKVNIDTILKIEFFLPNNKALAARYKEFTNVIGHKIVILGKVVRLIKKNNENFELGIQFINMYEGDFTNLKRFLELVDKNYVW